MSSTLKVYGLKCPVLNDTPYSPVFRSTLYCFLDISLPSFSDKVVNLYNLNAVNLAHMMIVTSPYSQLSFKRPGPGTTPCTSHFLFLSQWKKAMALLPHCLLCQDLNLDHWTKKQPLCLLCHHLLTRACIL